MKNFIDDIPDDAGVRSISEMCLDCAPFLLERRRMADSFLKRTGDVRINAAKRQ